MTDLADWLDAAGLGTAAVSAAAAAPVTSDHGRYPEQNVFNHREKI